MERLQSLIKMIFQYSQETAAAAQILISATVAIIGGWSPGIQVFVILIFLDYLAGFLRAAKNGNLNSTVGFMGVVKKTGYFIILALFFQLGNWVGNTTEQAMFARNLVVNIFIINEAVSVFENVRNLDEDDYLPHGILELMEGILAEDLRKQLKELPDGYDD